MGKLRVVAMLVMGLGAIVNPAAAQTFCQGMSVRITSHSV